MRPSKVFTVAQFVKLPRLGPAVNLLLKSSSLGKGEAGPGYQLSSQQLLSAKQLTLGTAS